jgi:alpha-beta hydrolase superfamily lysophospholipase
VQYPYLLVIGEKDTLVSNSAAKEWHAKTSSKVKELKMIAGSYHELSKEPNSHVLLESILKFIEKQREGSRKLGEFSMKDIKFAK